MFDNTRYSIKSFENDNPSWEKWRISEMSSDFELWNFISAIFELVSYANVLIVF